MRRFPVLLVLLIMVVSYLPTPAIAQASLAPCKIPLGIGTAAKETDAECLVVEVPEDRSKPDGKKLAISVTLLRAQNPQSVYAPIFHLDGGPGASAIKQFGQIWYPAYAALRRDHDIVLMDQRGTGKSSPLQCTEFTEAAFEDINKAPTPDAEIADSVGRLKACLARLSTLTDPANYTTNNLADDIDAVREALGYQKINLFGSSYGTWLAQIYLARHGERVNAAVLEGVVGPWNAPFLNAGPGYEAALNKVLALCKADAACNSMYPDLPGLLQKALDRIKDQPAQTSGVSSLTGKSYPLKMTPERLLQALVTMVGQGPLVGSVPQAIAQAAVGNYLLTGAVVVAQAEQPDAVALGMYLSIACAEMFAFYSDEQIAAALNGSFYGEGDKFIRGLAENCKVWRSAELDPADVAPVKSDRPVLLLAGELDPNTPVEYARETNARLPNSTLAVFPYQGHGVLPFNRCAQNLAGAFFKQPDAVHDTSCTARDVRPVFAGTYKAPEFIRYTDPNQIFTASVPKGWKRQPPRGNGSVTFFASPDELALYLGVGLVRGANARQRVIDAVSAQFGPITEQATLNSFGISVSQYNMSLPDEEYIGALVMFELLGESRVVWYAAPGNVFTATFETLLLSTFMSIN